MSTARPMSKEIGIGQPRGDILKRLKLTNTQLFNANQQNFHLIEQGLLKDTFRSILVVLRGGRISISQNNLAIEV